MLASLRSMMKIEGSGSVSIRGMDLRIRIHTKMSWIRNTASQIRIFFIQDLGSTSKNLSILTQKNVSFSSRKYDPGCSSRIRILIFYPSLIPDPGVKKAPDPGSGSATLNYLHFLELCSYFTLILENCHLPFFWLF